MNARRAVNRRRRHAPAAPAVSAVQLRIQRRIRSAADVEAEIDVAKLFRQYDQNHSGQLSLSGFCEALRHDCKLTQAQVSDVELKDLFDQTDTDMSGTIGIEEFKTLLETPSPATGERGALSPRQRAAVHPKMPTRADSASVVQPWSEGGGKKAADTRRKTGRQALQRARRKGAAASARSSSPRPQHSLASSERAAACRARSSRGDVSVRQSTARRGKLRQRAAKEMSSNSSVARRNHTVALEEALARMAGRHASAADGGDDVATAPKRVVSPGERMSASMFEARWADELHKLAAEMGQEPEPELGLGGEQEEQGSEARAAKCKSEGVAPADLGAL